VLNETEVQKSSKKFKGGRDQSQLKEGRGFYGVGYTSEMK
jgi:hypothetical protein